MNADLVGRAALVTGGSSGIGLAIVEALLDEGAHVAVVSRHPEPALIERLNKRDGRAKAIAISADVSREDDVVRMISEAIDQFGQLDLYVNNAARALHQPVTKIDTRTFRTILDTNLTACIWACREAAKDMISRASGSILIVGSTSMYTPGPTEAVYRVTKHGLKSLVESLAIELAPHGVRVNLLVPGHFPTRLTENIPPHIEAQLKQEIPLRRFGATSDCGKAAVFLLSDSLSGYTTGAKLVVDGGLSLRPLYFGTDDSLGKLNAPG